MWKTARPLMVKTCRKKIQNVLLKQNISPQNVVSVPAPGLYMNMTIMFSNIFETAMPIREEDAKIYKIGLGHLTKMGDIPIYGKYLKNLLFQNRRSFDLESYHAVFGS